MPSALSVPPPADTHCKLRHSVREGRGKGEGGVKEGKGRGEGGVTEGRGYEGLASVQESNPELVAFVRRTWVSDWSTGCPVAGLIEGHKPISFSVNHLDLHTEQALWMVYLVVEPSCDL